MKLVNISSTTFWRLGAFSATLFAALLNLSSCKEDNEPGPAPTITLSSATASNSPGQAVSTSVTVDAPEGGKTLSILVNGAANAALPDIDLAGEKSKSADISFTIPANAVVGSTQVISFVASDKKDRNSSPANFVVTVTAVPAKQIVEVPAGNITTNTTWTADKVYRLNGFVRIGKDEKPAGGTTPAIVSTAVLTIEPGTVILGKKGTPGGALIIHRGSKIVANGTKEKPIVLTSDQPIGSRKLGDWAGLVICGQAANNIKGSTGTDGIAELEGSYGAFHGASPAVATDNSGSLQYVRVEYAGYPINPNQEINGITFGSVGSGTVVDYVQVTYANDDSFEWFGGAVNAKHIIAYKGIDDDFDTDNGFSGNVQFGLGIRDAGIADQSGSNGFEADNDGSGTTNTPFTTAAFSNMTIIGPKAEKGTTISLQFFNGAHLRRSVKQKIINSVITAYPTGIFIDGTQGGAITNAASGELVLKNNVLAGVEGWGGNGFGSAATADEVTALGLSAAGSNHPNNPRGRVIAAGIGKDAAGNNSNTPFTNGVFTYAESQINGVSAIAWFTDPNTNKNKVYANWNLAALGLNATIFEPLTGTPNLLPAAGSSLLTGADFAGFSGFDTSISHKGAFGTSDWTAGWTNWNPGIADYTK